jgi:hypothetical protein
MQLLVELKKTLLVCSINIIKMNIQVGLDRFEEEGSEIFASDINFKLKDSNH